VEKRRSVRNSLLSVKNCSQSRVLLTDSSIEPWIGRLLLMTQCTRSIKTHAIPAWHAFQCFVEFAVSAQGTVAGDEIVDPEQIELCIGQSRAVFTACEPRRRSNGHIDSVMVGPPSYR
jgi:hypothetical protein